MRNVVSILALAASGSAQFSEVKTGRCPSGGEIQTVSECMSAINAISPDGFSGAQASTESNQFYPLGCYITYGMAYVNAGDPAGTGQDCTDLAVCYCKSSTPAPGGGGGGGGGGGDGEGGSSGCGGGCAFLIIFFVGGFVYLAAGIAYNYRQEKRGAEMVPNIAFWKDFPFLVKDGVMFTVNKIKGNGQGYSAVV